MRCTVCDAALTAGARFCASCAAPAPQPQGDPADALRTALESALGFQYRVERLLGRGGMGAVYLATELALDREVAIKVLPPDRDAADEGRARFRREARTAARLNHPHIVPLITFGEVPGLAYYVMGYVRGESLAAVMKREGALEPAVVGRILAELADALDHAHRQGIVHRDLKPDNVMLDADSGRAMLTDFGIARSTGAEAITSTGMIVGTPRYMSPEQAAGSSEIDGRSDIYSLGLLGYELLAGRTPFDGGTPADQIVQRLSRDPAPLAAHVPEAPAWLTHAITRCLRRAPAERWPDARALRQQLLAGSTDEELPLALQSLRFYSELVGLGWLFGLGYWLWGRASLDPHVLRVMDPIDGNFDPDPVLVSMLFAIPLLAFVSLDVHRKGHAWAVIRRAVTLQPRWWMGWYPRRGRAAGDVWHRLPRHVRLARVLLSLLFLIPPVVMLRTSIDMTALEQYERTGKWVGLHKTLRDRFGPRAGIGLTAYPSMVVVLLAIASTAWSLRKLRRGPLSRVDPDEVMPVFSRSTANARFWSKPIYADMLRPAAPASRPMTTAAIEAATLTRGDGPDERPRRVSP